MVTVLIDKIAYKYLKVSDEKNGINSLPEWLKTCQTATQLEERLEVHKFDFFYVNEFLLLVVLKGYGVKPNKTVDVSFKVLNE